MKDRLPSDTSIPSDPDKEESPLGLARDFPHAFYYAEADGGDKFYIKEPSVFPEMYILSSL